MSQRYNWIPCVKPNNGALEILHISQHKTQEWDKKIGGLLWSNFSKINKTNLENLEGPSAIEFSTNSKTVRDYSSILNHSFWISTSKQQKHQETFWNEDKYWKCYQHHQRHRQYKRQYNINGLQMFLTYYTFAGCHYIAVALKRKLFISNFLASQWPPTWEQNLRKVTSLSMLYATSHLRLPPSTSKIHLLPWKYTLKPVLPDVSDCT